jgi:hypothetical protein
MEHEQHSTSGCSHYSHRAPVIIIMIIHSDPSSSSWRSQCTKAPIDPIGGACTGVLTQATMVHSIIQSAVIDCVVWIVWMSGMHAPSATTNYLQPDQISARSDLLLSSSIGIMLNRHDVVTAAARNVSC